MSERKSNIKVADMSPEMQSDALDIAQKAISQHQMERDIASYVKKEFERRYTPTWQCIVGRNFGADVVHENKNLIYFYVGQVSILLWKTG